MIRARMIALAALATAGLTRPTLADIVPNPGTAVVETASTTASVNFVETPMMQRVDDYATLILATLNGASMFSMSFALPFTDNAVQQAVAAADAILAGSNASYGAPTLTGSNMSLQSSVTTPADPPTLTCAQLTSGAYAQTGNVSASVTQTFGPATIAVGDCKADTFTVLPGQLDVNTNIDVEYAVPVGLLTTNTYLTSQAYLIAGTNSGAPVPVPEPGTAALLLGCGALLGVRRRRQ